MPYAAVKKGIVYFTLQVLHLSLLATLDADKHLRLINIQAYGVCAKASSLHDSLSPVLEKHLVISQTHLSFLSMTVICSR